MRVLDLDMDYFMEQPPYINSDESTQRLDEENYGGKVWNEAAVRNFLEKNLGLSKNCKKMGRIVSNHDEALEFWKQLIERNILKIPFEVVHVDSHADLGCGYESYEYLMKNMLGYPVEERPYHTEYIDTFGNARTVGMGDYLLYAVAFRWISKIIYCGNPGGTPDDYVVLTLKNFKEETIGEDVPVKNTIQLLYNAENKFPFSNWRNEFDIEENKKVEKHIENSQKEPTVPFWIIPTIEDVRYRGSDFDVVLMAQSPNYTPASADYIVGVFKEYIIEI